MKCTLLHPCDWGLGMDKWVHTTLHWACGYLSIQGLKLVNVSKRSPWDTSLKLDKECPISSATPKIWQINPAGCQSVIKVMRWFHIIVEIKYIWLDLTIRHSQFLSPIGAAHNYLFPNNVYLRRCCSYRSKCGIKIKHHSKRMRDKYPYILPELSIIQCTLSRGVYTQ